jgi:hypothetical protein
VGNRARRLRFRVEGSGFYDHFEAEGQGGGVEIQWSGLGVGVYKGTSLIRNDPLLGPYRRTMSRAIRWP